MKKGVPDFNYTMGVEVMESSIYVPTGAPAFIYYDKEFFDVFNSSGYDWNPMATIYVPVKALLIKRLFSFFKS